MAVNDLMPLRRQDFEIGKVLQWPVFDRDHKLLLKEGQLIQSERQLETLLKLGMYRDSRWKPGRFVRPDVVDDEKTHEPAKQDKSSFISIEQIPFKLGDTLQVLPSADDANPYYVKLFGLYDKGSVIISTPSANGSLVLLREGQPFRIRAFLGRAIYSFDTYVVKSVLTPYPYVHLKIPEKAQVINVRSASRVNVNIVASFEMLDEDFNSSKNACLISDISLHGARLNMMKKVCEIEQPITLAFRVNVLDTDHYISLEATVKSINVNDAEKQPIALGVKFGEVQFIDKLVIQNFLNQKLLAERAEA
ncbi:flagellar brake protein [Leeia sp. TBRC 13508]|uniref:Flagellar brake protein n=1 Tax=Leeia speluncae TaxID=2884804 RepID=A0ABS8D6W5_9NEIS|nr:flagellar brake protein [Leeia speluncae]MCB6183887.1 flagellar brake protein [Leeia speluncae]